MIVKTFVDGLASENVGEAMGRLDIQVNNFISDLESRRVVLKVHSLQDTIHHTRARGDCIARVLIYSTQPNY